MVSEMGRVYLEEQEIRALNWLAKTKGMTMTKFIESIGYSPLTVYEYTYTKPNVKLKRSAYRFLKTLEESGYEINKVMNDYIEAHQ